MFFLLLIFATSLRSTQAAGGFLHLNDVQLKQWKRILHYERSSSSVITPDFFVSDHGASDPELEFESSLKLIESQGAATTETEAFVCRFPLRTRFIEEVLNSKIANRPKCSALDDWKGKLSAMRIDLVYAASFLGNPASSFGHTLFKFVRRGADGKPRNDLLSFGVSYGAKITSHNPVAYIFNGTFGIFHGYYYSAPYYEKLREYNAIDNRNLWDFELNLTQEEIDKSVEHLWELSTVQMRYYFFTKNCSFQLMTFLEAVDRRFDLSSHFYVSVIPIDTIRLLQSQGLIGKFHMRPSQEKAINAAWKSLNDEEKDSVMQARETRRLSGKEDTAVLDLLISRNLVDMNQHPEDKSYQGFQNDVLESRKKYPPVVEQVKVEEPADGPHMTSQDHALFVGGMRNEVNSVTFGGRIVSKYWLENQMERERLSEMVIGDFRVKVSEKKLSVSQIDFLKIASLPASTSLFPHTAWRSELGMQERTIWSCKRCLSGRLSAEFGKNWALTDTLYFYTLLGVRTDLVSFTISKDDAGLTEFNGLVYTASKDISMSLEFGPSYLVNRHFGWMGKTSLNLALNKSWFLVGGYEKEIFRSGNGELGKLEAGYRF